MTMDEYKAKAVQTLNVSEIGFNPYDYLAQSTHPTGEAYWYIPLNIQIKWFRAVYPQGGIDIATSAAKTKILSAVTHVANSIFLSSFTDFSVPSIPNPAALRHQLSCTFSLTSQKTACLRHSRRQAALFNPLKTAPKSPAACQGCAR